VASWNWDFKKQFKPYLPEFLGGAVAIAFLIVWYISLLFAKATDLTIYECLTLGVSLIALALAILGAWLGSNQFKTQHQLNLFSEFTKRYHELEQTLPNCFFNDCVESNKYDCDDQIKIKRYMLQYFDLCSEELFMRQKHFVNDETMELWKRGMKTKFMNNSFRAFWEQNKLIYTADFRYFINKII